jgi:hypothetical protein
LSSGLKLYLLGWTQENPGSAEIHSTAGIKLLERLGFCFLINKLEIVIFFTGLTGELNKGAQMRIPSTVAETHATVPWLHLIPGL